MTIDEAIKYICSASGNVKDMVNEALEKQIPIGGGIKTYYKCENCINRHNCPENQSQYKKLCSAIDKLTKKREYHSYYSLTIKCDYWIADESTMEQEVYCCNNGAP